MFSLPHDRNRAAHITLTLGALTAFAPFATDMYLASFPSLAQHFGTSVDKVQLTLSIYFFGIAFGQLIYGPLIDRYGRRRPLLVGIGIYALASMLIVVAPTIESMIGLRLLQSMAGSAGMVISRAVIRDVFDDRESAHVLAQLAVVQTLSPIIAPLVGGYILLLGGWRAVFVFLAAFGVFCFAMTTYRLPETLPPERRHAQDWRQLLGAFAALLRKREFVLPTLSASFAMGAIFAFITGSPFVLMELHGLSPQHYGWLFGSTALGFVLGAQLNRFLLKRITIRTVLTSCVYVALISGCIALFETSASSLWLLMIPIWICLATGPMISANGAALAMRASGAYIGSASALFGLMQLSIGSLASALVGMLHNGTAYPMTGIIFVSTVGGLIVSLFARSKITAAP